MNPAQLAATGPTWWLLLSGLTVLLTAAIGVYAAGVPQGGGRWWILMGLVGVLAAAALFITGDLVRMALLEAAAFAAVALVWIGQAPGAAKAARNYLALLVVATVALGAGRYLAPGSAAPAYPFDHLAAVLLVIGFGLKLALVPFYFWLPAVAEASPSMTTALIVGVVDIDAFGELALLRTAAPWVFEQYAALWLALALLSMFGGALLALAQRDLRRLLAFSTVDDLGYLLLGVVAGPGAGLAGAWLGAMSHALFKVMLFAALGVAEARLGRPVTLDDGGLAVRFPVSATAFVAGALGVLGVPPLFGFTGRWRLYLAGVQLGGWPLLLTMALATVLALLYYVRAIHRVWLGPAQPQTGAVLAPAGNEPALARAVLVVLMLAGVGLGLCPYLVTGRVG